MIVPPLVYFSLTLTPSFHFDHTPLLSAAKPVWGIRARPRDTGFVVERRRQNGGHIGGFTIRYLSVVVYRYKTNTKTSIGHRGYLRRRLSGRRFAGKLLRCIYNMTTGQKIIVVRTINFQRRRVSK